MDSTTTRQLRAAVEKQGLLRDRRFATHKAILALAPDLLDVLRACASSGSNAVFKARGETPVDQILIEQGMRGSGGQVLRMQTVLNRVLADRDLSLSIGTVKALLKQADIKALAVKHTLNPPKVGKHYCAAEIKTHRQIAHLFSAYCVRLSIDQKANLKSNSDHNTAEGGNRKKFQVSSERTLTYSHGAGGDHLAKYGLFSMLLLPARASDRVALGLDSFDLGKYIESYKAAEAFAERPGLAFVLGHCQSVEPETAYRDAADVAEMIETYPQYFCTANKADGAPSLVPFMIFEKDNSHGVADISCRFSFTLLALLYDLDYLCIGSQEAGYSMLHIVESMNGALSRRLNGAPFTLDLPAPEAASDEDLRCAEKLVLKEICRRANGATYSTGGGHISVAESRSTLLRSGFVFRPAELAAYVEAAKAGTGDAFLSETLKPMDGFSGDYAQLLARTWRVLHVTGAFQCTKTTAHGFHFCKNELNPDCLPRRGPQCFYDFLGLFGGAFPQPKPSVDRPFVDAKREPGHYMDLAERCSEAGRGATGLDEYYPKVVLDERLADTQLALIDTFLDGGNTLPANLRDELCKGMCTDEATLYADLIERIAKMEYARKYKELANEQKADGTVAIVAIVVEATIKKPEDATASWPHVGDLKTASDQLKIKYPKGAKRATLLLGLFNFWLALPQERKDALCSPAAAASARQAAAAAAAAARARTAAALHPAVAAAPAAHTADTPHPAPITRVRGADASSLVAAAVAAANAAAVAAGQRAACGVLEEADAGGEIDSPGTEPDPEDVAGIIAQACTEEPDDEDDELSATAAAEQTAAASLVDTLAVVEDKDCAACTRACGERFSHLTMTAKAKGYKNVWVCADREACLQRQLAPAGGGGGRPKRARTT